MNKKILFLTLSFFLFLLALYLPTANSYDNLATKINNVFKAEGINGGYVKEVKYGLPYQIYLRGNYLNEQQFDYAFRLAQAIAGPTNVYPGYNVIHTNIIIRNLEECVAGGITGNLKMCPSAMPVIPTLTSYGKNKKYALIIAVGNFKYFPNSSLRSAPQNDAKLVAGVLKQKNFKITTLINKEATLKNTENTIKNMLAKMPDGSTFVIYASSHGTKPSHNGVAGIVLYNTTPYGNGCNKTFNNLINSGLSTSNKNSNSPTQSRSIVLKVVSKVNGWCNVSRTTLHILGKNGIINMVEASGKKINLIVIPDVCYTGSEYHENYATSSGAAHRLAGSLATPIIFIGAANGKQHAEQMKIDNVEHGVFTYYYFSNLKKYDFKAYKDFKLEYSIIKKESPDKQTPVFKNVNKFSNNFKF